MTLGINWKICGPAGFGIMSVGRMFAKTCLRHGWQVFCYTEYPSLIRGGHNTYQVHANPKDVKSQKKNIEILIALNENTIVQNQGELTDGGAVIYDPEKIPNIPDKKPSLKYLEVPLNKISKEICGTDLMKNTVAMGASLGIYQGELEILNDLIKEEFASKKGKIIQQNIEAAKKGYEFVGQNSELITGKPKLTKIKAPERILITGNEAVSLGALAAGCKFYAAYPMTPATSILHFLAKQERNYDMVVKQAEDEIAVINMAIGASFAGARSLCATSGGGFALMNESLGFAAIAEIPLVVILSQRTAPATGLPTWTGQGDLWHAVHASHGEFLRVVVAPGDSEEAFWATVGAFNLADKYQIPVIILLDKYTSEGPHSVAIFDTAKVKIDRGRILTQTELDKIKDYKRYQFVADGISARTLPGMKGGTYQANSDEHDEYGYSTEEAEVRNKIMEKRMAKLPALAQELPDPKIYGDKNADKTIICWGSTKMPALEAMKELNNVQLVHLQYLLPFPVDFFTKNINPEKSIVIEGNQTGQLKQLIRQQTGINIQHSLLKYDGRPFYPEEIVEAINKLKSK
ncbi:2-oxoacid:acceptor oxidoreductase subunit alpha [Patescibacteria group bacterium]|nr:2-oxoacid:acceptor oxidoreductase subunit alpha [Patescibacteria group bacterium]